MTDNSSPDNRSFEAADPELRELIPKPIELDDHVVAVFIESRRRTATDRYDLEALFVGWAWESGYRDWNAAVRALARALRGLAAVGLLERRTIRRVAGRTHHGFALTQDGQEALRALSGDWIEDARAVRDE